MNRGPRGQAAARVAARRAEAARTPYAGNWRRILLVDAGVGAIVFVVGLVLLFAVNVWIGAGVGALGASYVVLVGRRYRYWRELRERRGLDD